jgi:hypothetical protein
LGQQERGVRKATRMMVQTGQDSCRLALDRVVS